MDKILITGTGRSGTTFLIKIFSFLGYDTGFTKDNYKQYIYTNCNSGMEKDISEKHYILKSPFYIENINSIINDLSINIKLVIIPVRNYEESAQSRVNHKNDNGGLWKSKDKKSQIKFYNKIMADYIFYMVKYDIKTIFIDFDKMIKDKKYLFNKIKCVLDEKNIKFEEFCKEYDNSVI